MRTAADPSFFFKLAVECGLDATIIVVVNLLARKERFISELEFVLSQASLYISGYQSPGTCLIHRAELIFVQRPHDYATKPFTDRVHPDQLVRDRPSVNVDRLPFLACR